MVEVFSGVDVFLSIAPKFSKNINKSVDNTFDIDNKGNKDVIPKIIITSDTTVELNNIKNNYQELEFENDITITDTDELILNFKDQIYELNNNNIISNLNFPNNQLIYLVSNEINTFEINANGTLNFQFEFDSYDTKKEVHYKDNFTLNRRPGYEDLKPFNSNKIISRDYQGTSYSFTIGKKALDWIDEEKEYRIEYEELNEDTLDCHYKYLVGVVFDNVRRGFNEPTGIINNRLSGEAIDVLDKKI